METTGTPLNLQLTTALLVSFYYTCFFSFLVLGLKKNPSYVISFKVMETLVIVDFCPCLKFNLKRYHRGG